jgi:hypothetical protein
MAKFKEILFKRNEVQEHNPDKLTVTFERVREVKEVTMTQAEADMLNAGKTTSPGNAEFTLLLKEGDNDPETIVNTVQKSGGIRKVEEKSWSVTGLNRGRKIKSKL